MFSSAESGFRFHDRTVRLSQFHVFVPHCDRSGFVSIGRPSSRAALVKLVKHVYTLATVDRMCCNGETLDIRRLAYPSVFDCLTNVGDAMDAERRLIR